MNHRTETSQPVTVLFGDMPPAVGSFLLFFVPLIVISIILGTAYSNYVEKGKAARSIIKSVKSRQATRGQTAPCPTSPDSPSVIVSNTVNEDKTRLTLSHYWSQKISFTRLAQELSFEQRKLLLADTLRSHDSGWILKLLRCPCLLVIGRPGSAKSSFAGGLGIIREVGLTALKKTVVIDPNAHLKVEKEIWQSSWELRGSRDSWDDIENAISDMNRRFADSQGENHVSSIYDELTVYEEKVDPSKLSGFISQITSKARAAKEYITIVSHNDTLKCLGGQSGQAKLKDDMVKLFLASESTDMGEFRPTGKGHIEGLSFDEKNKPLSEQVTIPRWFEPCILKHLFPELYGPKTVTGLKGKIVYALQESRDPLSLRELRVKTKDKGENAEDYGARSVPVIEELLAEKKIEDVLINGVIKYKLSHSDNLGGE